MRRPRSTLSRRVAPVAVAAVAALAVGMGTAAAGPLADIPGVPGLPGASSGTGDAEACDMTRTEEYPTSSPAAVGLDAAKLQAAIDYWNSTGSENLKVFRHSCLVGEGALDAVTDRTPRINWSNTKTVSALIAGVAERQGLIDVDATLDDYLPEGLGDEAHRAITVRSVLTMSTGTQMNWARGLNQFGDISRPREAMSAEIEHEPEAYFEYDQTTPSVLNYIVQQAIWAQEPGLDYQDWAQREFFDRLGIPRSAYFWQRDRAGNTLGYSQLFLRPLEFGRLGELMLNQGSYQDVQLIDEDYLAEMGTGSAANCGYGFLVWVNGCTDGDLQVTGSIFTRRQIDPQQAWIASAPDDMYYSWGLHGQHVFVIPSLDMIVTRTGETPPDTVPGLPRLDGDAVIAGEQKLGYFEFFELLMAAVTDMPDDVRAQLESEPGNIAEPDLNVDPDTFVHPVDTVPGSYAGVGEHAPEGCTIMGCEGEPNNGIRWPLDAPRTAPGIVGAEERPNG